MNTIDSVSIQVCEICGIRKINGKFSSVSLVKPEMDTSTLINRVCKYGVPRNPEKQCLTNYKNGDTLPVSGGFPKIDITTEQYSTYVQETYPDLEF